MHGRNIEYYQPMSYDCNLEKATVPQPLLNITKLVVNVNFDEFNIVQTNLSSEPVIFDGIVFRLEYHLM